MKKQKTSTKPSVGTLSQKQNNSFSYEDFVVLTFIVAVLIIDFFPYFGAFEIIAPQFLYLACLNAVVITYIYRSKELYTLALQGIFKRSLVFKLYVVFILFCMVSLLFAVNMSLSVVTLAELFIVFSLVLNFSMLLNGRLHLLLKICFLVGLAALFQSGKVLYEFYNAAQEKSLSYVFNESNILKGNTGNINILAASLMIKLPFIFFGIVNAIKLRRLVLILGLVAAVLIILLINARATLLSLVAIVIVFVIFNLRSKLTKTSLLKIGLVVLPLVASYFIANKVFEKAALNEERFTSTIDRLGAVNTQDASSGRRLQIWKAAIGLIKDHPITGVGIGNYRVESIPYDLSTSETIPLHAHNDFLEIASETGVLNGLVYFTLFFVLLLINIKRYFRDKEQQVRDVAFVTLMLLIVYGMDALVNFPLLRPTMVIGFCFIMAFTLVNVREREVKDVAVVTKKIGLLAIAIAIVPIFVGFKVYKASVLERDIQTDNINLEPKGVLSGKDVLDRMAVLPNVFNTSEAFVEYAGIYFLREKKYEQAIKLLDEGNKINPYLGRPDFFKSIIANEKGNLDSAYIYVKKAFYTRPVNETFYTTGLMYAVMRKDTAEITKFYETYVSHIQRPHIWEQAYVSLRNAGAGEEKLQSFAKIGAKTFPNDALIVSAVNATKITALIVEAQALTDQGKLDQALANYNKGLSLDPHNIYVNQNLGFHYFNLKDYKTASRFFLKSLASPGLNGGKTEFYLSVSLSSIGNIEDACKYAQIAKEKGFPNAQFILDQYKCK
jgi:O-antigen ligase/tetratricopeptide (TPR) repeat protein